MNSHKLTTAEAAEYLGLSATTLKVWRHRGKGPPYEQPGGKGTTPLYDLRGLEVFAAMRQLNAHVMNHRRR